MHSLQSIVSRHDENVYEREKKDNVTIVTNECTAVNQENLHNEEKSIARAFWKDEQRARMAACMDLLYICTM